jgi:hypothetical protein
LADLNDAEIVGHPGLPEWNSCDDQDLIRRTREFLRDGCSSGARDHLLEGMNVL